MHIPDGFLSNRLALSLDVVSATSVVYAARRVRLEASARVVPMMGVLGAFVFAAQMLNFPILGGTSGHLVGGALLSILLGPMAALLTITTVVIAQALFLQDGGLFALGANIFNIGAITCFSGYAVFQALCGPRIQGRRLALAAFCAGWVSMLLSAAGCALQLGISGAIPLRVGIPAMEGYHALIGIAEGALTAGILSLLLKVRPDLVAGNSGAPFGVVDWIGALILIAIPFAVFALGGFSRLPDPLEALLLGSTAGMETPTKETLVSSSRFLDYVWRILTFAVFLFIAWAVVRLAGKRSKDA